MKIINSIKIAAVAAVLTITPSAFADDDRNMNMQETKKSFTSLGANISYQSIYGDKRVGAGIEALYMHKVWGGFSLGGNLTGQTTFRNAINGETVISGGVALLLGGIQEFSSGARSAYFVGPVVEAGNGDALFGFTAGTKYQFPQSHWTLGASVTTGLGVDTSRELSDTTKLKLSVGYTF